jgi:fused signal recognition particle receptor
MGLENDLILWISSGLGLLTAISAGFFFFRGPSREKSGPQIEPASPTASAPAPAASSAPASSTAAAAPTANYASTSATAAAATPTPAPWEKALKKSREPLLSRWKDAISELTSGESWNPQHPVWERLEETLLAADLGPKMTELLLDSLKKDFLQKPEADSLKSKLREKMLEVFAAVPIRQVSTDAKPFVTVLIGVNGAGKTTTAGKLAAQAKANGKKVILGAGDTFRAAAVEQLKVWADRIGVECILPAQGANPAAVAFDAVAAGIARDADEVIIDTAGRLHTKDNLMEELKKVIRVIEKKIPGAPHRILLVLDATLGQNALLQAKEFSAVAPASGVVLTKLDGSAKGGAAFSVSADLGLPVSYVGIGESVDDLRTFSPQEFVQNLLP